MSIITKNFVKHIGLQYNLGKKSDDIPIFEVLWELFQIGNKYRRKNKALVKKSLFTNYRALIASMLNSSSLKEYPGSTFDDVIRLHDVSNSVFKRIKTIKFSSRETIPIGHVRVRNPNPPSVNPFGRNPFTRENTVGLGSRPQNFVIFSDHHMTEKGHRHNYFEKNKELYKELLRYYADHDFGLIENGDVEEYTIFEPTIKIANGYNELIEKDPDNIREEVFGEDIGSVNWTKLKEQRTKNRKKILPKIIRDNVELYNLIHNLFAKKGPNYYSKVTGNHDPYLTPELVRLLPPSYQDNLCDAVKIFHNPIGESTDSYLKYFVTHGHQFDSSTLPQHAYAMGEVFSETLGWTIQGADRIWDGIKTETWRNPNKEANFRNVLATAKADDSPESIFSGFAPGADSVAEFIIEDLMQGHEIAWEYFDNTNKAQAFSSEVMTGDEYFKVRHLSETKLVQQLHYWYAHSDIRDWPSKPKLIIGHTHEPRLHPRIKTNEVTTAPHYLNTGSAGRFENLIWGLEITQGTEKIVSWTMDGTKMVRNHWKANNVGQLVKEDYPL
ncbi:hypothetical protein EHW67_06330 [Arenibacter aquaticus]|uniref:Uncharacterized protein n=1 Tax=Arenibacter aquaticus TaxID=2489054 RepID=A0A3S0B0G3_9FLAO|nr:hypothetical protein [Arenibacter aquaticus]RTE54780.1 hypothetical protein EHW67_06330 [Arenibacter aquaticus]